MTERLIVGLYGRDEESVLPKSLESIFTQSHRPKKVLYVDDCSLDSSPDIAESYGCEVVRLTRQHESYVGRPELALITNQIISHIDFSEYDFMMIAGTDVILSRDYIERLLIHMSRDKELVICSGVIMGEFSNVVRGAGRLFRVTFWTEHIKKFPLNYTNETYPVYKAYQLGFHVESFSDVLMTSLRPTKSYKQTYGYAMRELGYLPLYVLGKCLLAFTKSPQRAVKMLVSYLCSPYTPEDMGIADWIKDYQLRKIHSWIKRPLSLNRLQRED